MSSETSDDGVVFTAGVSSAVLAGDDCVGHVLLLDVDESDPLTVRRAAGEMGGVTALFESSPGSFHIWNLTVRDFETAMLDGLSWSIADPQHVAQSRRRGRYVLRAVAKVREDGERYKRPPQLREVYVADDVDEPQSLPHLRRVRHVADEQDFRGADHLPSVDDVPTVGDRDGLAVDRYMTLDDGTKAMLRGEGA